MLRGHRKSTLYIFYKGFHANIYKDIKHFSIYTTQGVLTVLAYVQVSYDAGSNASVSQVFEDLNSLPEVKEAHVLFGEWDFIAKIELTDPEGLGGFVVDNIRTIPGVKLTSTLIVAKQK